jgi:hypothetical protein
LQTIEAFSQNKFAELFQTSLIGMGANGDPGDNVTEPPKM